MWNWSHLKGEGWVAHTLRSVKLAALLLASGAAMLVHIVIPFWQQPEALQVCAVADTLCAEMKKRKGHSLKM